MMAATADHKMTWAMSPSASMIFFRSLFVVSGRRVPGAARREGTGGLRIADVAKMKMT